MVRRIARVVAVLPFLLFAAADAGAQYGRTIASAGDEGRYFDYFYAQRWSAAGAEQAGAAVGGRLMWAVDPTPPSRGIVLPRTYVGGYMMRVNGNPMSGETLHVGVQADLAVTRTIQSERVDPLVSLAVGALTQSREASGHAASLAALSRSGSTVPIIAPGIGVRLRLAPGLNLRTDLRRTQELGEDRSGYLEFATGVSLGT
jgi:hypothetical protein